MELAEYQALFQRKSRIDWRTKTQIDYFTTILNYKDICTAEIKPHDKVFIHSHNNAFTKGEIKEHVESLHASIVKSIEEATKIITANTDWHSRDYTTLPTEVDPFMSRYKIHVGFRGIEEDIRKMRESKREIHDFTYEGFENIIALISSRGIDNKKVACILIMSMDWTGNEFFLFFLFTKYANDIRSCRPSDIPNWSNFHRTQNIAQLQANPQLYDFFRFMKKFNISEEQQNFIKKYL